MNYKLRRIQDHDLEMIMNWRMSPEVTKYMNTDPVLTMEKQREWLQHINKDDSVEHWLITVDDIPVGVICLEDLDKIKKTTSWGYYVGEKKYRSIQLAISLEMSLYDYVFEVLGLETINSTAFSANTGVIHLHKLCGCRRMTETKGEVEKGGVKYDVTHLSLSRQEWFEYRAGKNYAKIDFNID